METAPTRTTRPDGIEISQKKRKKVRKETRRLHQNVVFPRAMNQNVTRVATKHFATHRSVPRPADHDSHFRIQQSVASRRPFSLFCLLHFAHARVLPFAYLTSSSYEQRLQRIARCDKAPVIRRKNRGLSKGCLLIRSSEQNRGSFCSLANCAPFIQTAI